MKPPTEVRDGPRSYRPAVEQVSRWARRAAEAGRHQDALSWMRALRAVDGALPGDLAALQHDCDRLVRDRGAAHSARRGALRPTLWYA